MSDAHSLPLYVQISELLIRDIQAGRLLDGERLPPEREMAASLKISVGTLRKSLAELEIKGLLERRQGSGNYVRHVAAADNVYALFRLELIEGGGLPTADVLSVAPLPKPADLPVFGTSKIAHRIRRLRRLNGQAAALEEIWLDAGYVENLAASDLSESLYLFYRNRLGLWIGRVEDRIGLGDAPDWGKGLIPGAQQVMCQVDRISWDQMNNRAEVSRTWFDPGTARYVSRIR